LELRADSSFVADYVPTCPADPDAACSPLHREGTFSYRAPVLKLTVAKAGTSSTDTQPVDTSDPAATIIFSYATKSARIETQDGEGEPGVKAVGADPCFPGLPCYVVPVVNELDVTQSEIAADGTTVNATGPMQRLTKPVSCTPSGVRYCGRSGFKCALSPADRGFPWDYAESCQ
jgi:hypothetical protein